MNEVERKRVTRNAAYLLMGWFDELEEVKAKEAEALNE